MATFHFDLVSPEKLAFSGEVDQVDVPGVEGDFGVLAGHAPVVAAIRPGILTVISGGIEAEDHRARRACGSLRQGSHGAGRRRNLARRTRSGASSPRRFPRWRPSSPKRKAPSSITRSSGSITSRASSTSSIRRRCTRRCCSGPRPVCAEVGKSPAEFANAAPRPGRRRAGMAPRDRRRDRAAPIAIGRIPAAGRCAMSAGRFPARSR